MFRPRPLQKPGLPTNNALGRNGRGLPGWASSSDFRDFEDGADGRLQPVQYGGGAAGATEDPFASQIADGVRPSGRREGVEQIGLLQPFKPEIIRQARAEGLTQEEAQYLYNRADKAAFGFVIKHGKPDAKVTPDEDRVYRQEIEKIVSDPASPPALRKKTIDFYERKFRDGTLTRSK